MTLFVSVCSLICSGAVIWMARANIRLIRQNQELLESIQSLFIEAVWPPHERRLDDPES